MVKSIDDDGNVKLKAEADDGKSIIESTYELFLAKYKLATEAARVFLDYPERCIVKSNAFVLTAMQGQVNVAMCSFYKANKVVHLSVRDKPSKALLSSKTISKKGALSIPIFGKVNYIEEDKGLPDRVYEVKGHKVDGYLFFIKTSMSDSNEEGICPASYIQYAKDDEEVNTTISWKSHDKLMMPFIQNTCKIDADGELKLKSPTKVEKEKSKSIVVDCGLSSAPKKARVA